MRNVPTRLSLQPCCSNPRLAQVLDHSEFQLSNVANLLCQSCQWSFKIEVTADVKPTEVSMEWIELPVCVETLHRDLAKLTQEEAKEEIMPTTVTFDSHGGGSPRNHTPPTTLNSEQAKALADLNADWDAKRSGTQQPCAQGTVEVREETFQDLCRGGYYSPEIGYGQVQPDGTTKHYDTNGKEKIAANSTSNPVEPPAQSPFRPGDWVRVKGTTKQMRVVDVSDRLPPMVDCEYCEFVDDAGKTTIMFFGITDLEKAPGFL